MNARNSVEFRSAGMKFEDRHVGLSAADANEMLRAIGAASIDKLLAETIPASIRRNEPLRLEPALAEDAALARLREIAGRNQAFTSLIGQGYHGTIMPATIRRNILENPAWYTSYTPYQPEISQGRLEALLNFQTLVADLTAFDVANASLLDEATAAAEAMALAKRVSSSRSIAFFVDREVHPQTLAVIRTRAEPLGWQVVTGDAAHDLPAGGVFGALFQLPGTFGDIRDFREPIAAVQRGGGVAIVAADPLALTLFASPGELGADIAVGSMQRFGVPMGYGGPHAGYIAVKDAYKRALPGRLVGVSLDAHGAPALRLALQTREQHIRREKATSNICTAEVLLAVIASMYAVYHGPDGLRAIATRIRARTAVLAAGLRRLGFAPRNGAFFDTVTVPVGGRQAEIVARAEAERINLRIIAAAAAAPEAALGITLDETTTPAVVEAVWRAFGGAFVFNDLAGEAADIDPGLARERPLLRHPVFHRYRTETELMRYMRRLADRDLALDRTMIPLGSCTMKLNAAAEMMPLSWPEFANIHPFAPAGQAAGYRGLMEDLARWLCEITGYDAFSLQPNSGAQGEFAGLLAIRAYHMSRGEAGRNVCLIPASAHGTNPASAHMAGLDVVVVACDEEGNVDVADLRAKAGAHAARLAAAMITYPSTHGVFEGRIREICDIVHRHGGQIYLDGANLNAQVGLCRPGDYGADVGHLNLHKTFAIPHGGGGPGVGPLGVKAHLAPFLPGHVALGGVPAAVGPVAAAPFGSASILTISYSYILMMGADGLRRASEAAILAANYIAARLDPHFPVLYKNEKGRIAHECVLDPRALHESCGVTVDDIAKRLIDYGFHAPTMSFPVPGTLMVEPTESESKVEIDRFCEAMIAIRREIADIERTRFAVEQSPLRHAPHTARDAAADDWTRPYARSEGCFPAAGAPADKYWPPVGRIDNVYGDRHPVLTCVMPEGLAQAAGSARKTK